VASRAAGPPAAAIEQNPLIAIIASLNRWGTGLPGSANKLLPAHGSFLTTVSG